MERKIMPESVARLRSLIPVLKQRKEIFASVRRSLDGMGYWEVDTPCGILAPAAEEYIEAPSAGNFFLRTSPELQMKRLLAAGMERIYQIGPCFREGENGRRHRSEFFMLEYYEAHSDYMQLLDHTFSFIRQAALDLHGEEKISFAGKEILLDRFECLSVREAFRCFANSDADACAREEALFEQILVEKVEPNLPQERLCVLLDYPVRFGAFARPKKEDPTLVERWELYGGGLELANAYGELVDPVIQRERLISFSRTRERMGLRKYPAPEAFLESIDYGIPPSAGAALGLDRLVMLLTGHQDIGEVSFPLDS
ncbi:MAG: EF-P lysine aminoacylase GenX [Lentisphaeria bacterium]|nr:EF-P lysine aminoacylase GenX [Lentisphaeria bacterium]